VTRGDLQKTPVRMWLFGLVSILEMRFLQLIKSQDHGDWWLPILTEKRLGDAKKIYAERIKKNEEIGIADCLQLCDKRNIISANPNLFEKTGYASKKEWKRVMVKVENLRNNLAHSNEINTGTWPEKAELALRIEELIRQLDLA
jgi:hypothetical protein